jgi:hypothetical protein
MSGGSKRALLSRTALISRGSQASVPAPAGAGFWMRSIAAATASSMLGSTTKARIKSAAGSWMRTKCAGGEPRMCSLMSRWATIQRSSVVPAGSSRCCGIARLYRAASVDLTKPTGGERCGDAVQPPLEEDHPVRQNRA